MGRSLSALDRWLTSGLHMSLIPLQELRAARKTTRCAMSLRLLADAWTRSPAFRTALPTFRFGSTRTSASIPITRFPPAFRFVSTGTSLFLKKHKVRFHFALALFLAICARVWATDVLDVQENE